MQPSEMVCSGAVLLVHSNARTLRWLAEGISRSFPQRAVLRASSGAEALSLAGRAEIAAALVDIHAGDMTGLELIGRLSSDQALGSFPLALLAASNRQRREGIEAGAEYFLSKPLETTSLEVVLVAMLRKQGARQRLWKRYQKLKDIVAERTGQLRQSQKRLERAESLETIGQLASGVAHDFNNMLTAILGNAQLLEQTLPAGQDTADLAREIIQAAGRAGQLTRSLLDLARQESTESIEIHLHRLIGEVCQMLQRTVDRRIKVRSNLQADDPVVEGDLARLHNALLNLAINGCDAMPDGGELVISTAPAGPEEMRTWGGADLPEGEYVLLCVSDSGTGIDLAVRETLFEPFVTTKESGKGTGLGLAGVQRCVETMDGSIDVASTPGRGSTFGLLLPMLDVARSAESNAPAEPVRGSGLILVVDDEPSLRRLTQRMLETLGYEVATCPDGAEAVAWCGDHVGLADLVLLDRNMPRKGGLETSRELHEIDPSLPIVLCSGDGDIDGAGDRSGVVDTLAKPFHLAELAEMIARHLPAPAGEVREGTHRAAS